MSTKATPKRILYVENGVAGGGASESLRQFLAVIDRKQFQPFVVVTTRTAAVQKFQSLGDDVFFIDHWYVSAPKNKVASVCAKLAKAVVIHGAKCFPETALWLDGWFSRTPQKKLVEYMKLVSADLVHTNNNAHRDLWAIQAAEKAGVRCVSHLRSFHGLGFSRARVSIANRAVKKFIGYSRSITDYWQGLGVDPEKVRVVHNAIGSFKAQEVNIRAELSLADDQPLIGIVGRLIKERGYELLFAAMAHLNDSTPDLRLLVIGGGSDGEVARVQGLAKKFGVSERTIFLGHRSDAQGIIARLDVLVLPYSIEPFGRIVLEAWMLGVPVVLSRVGHIGDIITDGVDGLLCDPVDPADCAEKIGSLLWNSSLKASLTEAGRRTCVERFTIEAHARAVEHVYRDVLGMVDKV